MGLIERMIGIEAPRIAAHQFTAALGEGERGKTTRAEIIAFFGIQPAEEADLDAIIAKIMPIPDSYALGGYLVLTGIGTTYDNVALTKGLGFAALEGAGITGIEFRPRFNKVGTGTLSFQLWNETTSAELAVADDAVVGDNKSPVVTFTPGSPVAPGTHILRVQREEHHDRQAPVYYGASLRVRRVAALWSKILEEICVLAEKGYPTLDTAAEVRTRLGI